MTNPLPSGIEHVLLLEKLREYTVANSKADFAKFKTEFSIIGASLSALYQAATCERKCHGGSHVLESLCGRSYNLGAAALDLMLAGYYDESLNLQRSLGEISNLISLSVVDKDALKDWLNLDTVGRIRRFTPAAVRKMLAAKPGGKALMYADQDWYSHFCEAYTHITPETKPNMHGGIPQAGGIYQANGLEKSVSELTSLLTHIALIICRYFKFDDLFSEIGTYIRSPQQR